MQTFSGRAFYPLDPCERDVCIEDIAHALACQNRFAGHTTLPYSVAEHSVRCARYVERRFRALYPHASLEHERRAILAALLHDATEAYLVDLPRPVKRFMPDYKIAEDRLAGVIELWAGLPKGALGWDLVKSADEAILATEARDLLSAPPRAWNLRAAPLDETIRPWSWERAKEEFLRVFSARCATLDVAIPSHYHHCPECYQKAPCRMSCTILDEEDGVSLGGACVCGDCGAASEGGAA